MITVEEICQKCRNYSVFCGSFLQQKTCFDERIWGCWVVDAVAFNQKVKVSSGMLWLLLKGLHFRKTSKKSGLHIRVVERKRGNEFAIL